MAAYLTCQSISGLPLFVRRKGDIPSVCNIFNFVFISNLNLIFFFQLPFPLVASLNGVHTFTKMQGAELESSSTDRVLSVWKEYHDTFVLCLSATDTSLTSEHLRHSLDLVFHTMIFYLGLDDLLNLKNIERTKKELKVMYYTPF